MSDSETVEFWKNERFQKNLEIMRKLMGPENPAGDIQSLSDEQLQQAQGGGTNPAVTAGCCQASVNYPTCQLGWCIGSAAFTGTTIICYSVQSC
jgi:mersacidin/lichenicidin family type 2 lantibiotic